MNFYRICSLLFIFILSACSDESKIKSLALDTAKSRLELKLQTESDKAIAGKMNLKNNYVSSILNNTEFEISNLSVNNLSAAATVRAKTVPPTVRQPLMEIINKLDDAKEKSFNVENAIGLVYQQVHIDRDQKSEEIYRINFAKKNEWMVLKGD